MLDAVDYQADHLHEAPVWIVPCLIGDRTWDAGSGIYPAVQNMPLAARAWGLGATLTTMVQYDADALLACQMMRIPTPFCRLAIRWANSVLLRLWRWRRSCLPIDGARNGQVADHVRA
jgi:hypothetical protein